jgi:hypothetical protein
VLTLFSFGLTACNLSIQPPELGPRDVAKIPLRHPPRISVEVRGDTTVIHWNGLRNDDASIEYRIYRRTAAEGKWQQIGTVQRQGNDNAGYTWTDTVPSESHEKVYGVAVYGGLGQKSAMRTSDNCNISNVDQPNEYTICDGN